MRKLQQSFHFSQRCTRQPDLSQAEKFAALFQQTQHHPFTKSSGETRNPDVNKALADLNLHATVLRQSLLGNVQPSHYLYSRNYRRMQSPGWAEHVVQHPVQTEAHLQVLLVRFNMDIAGLTLNSLGKNVIDQLDYGCLTGLI